MTQLSPECESKVFIAVQIKHTPRQGERPAIRARHNNCVNGSVTLSIKAFMMFFLFVHRKSDK